MEIVKLKISELTPYEKNAKKHPQEQIEQIKKSIQKYQMCDPIGVWGKKNIIVEGHGRLIALEELGYEEVDCIRLDHLTDKERKEYTIVHNKTTMDSDFDLDLLAPELEELDFLSDFSFDFGLLNEEEETAIAEGYAPEEDEEEQERIFKERMARGEIAEEDEEYQEFLQKFELKKTTDDCYTPDNIYEAVKKWCVEKYGLKGKKIIRPFYPGGDYQKEDYSGDCVVIDNPPFSIISEICAWYSSKGIDYFVFAPYLTVQGVNRGRENYVVTYSPVLYENGATVNTAFVTNLGDKKIITAPDLHTIIDEQNKINERAARKQLPKYSYPDEVCTAAMLGYMANHGVSLEIDAKDVYFIRQLDSQKESGKTLFGSGFLLSEKAAAEKAAAEKAAAEKAAAHVWELSAREREIIKSLG